MTTATSGSTARIAENPQGTLAEHPAVSAGLTLGLVAWLGSGFLALDVIAVLAAQVDLPGYLFGISNPAFVGQRAPRFSGIEMFAFLATVCSALALCALRHRLRRWKFQALVPLFVSLLTAAHGLSILSDQSIRSDDYRRYQVGAVAILEGRNPYPTTQFFRTSAGFSANDLLRKEQVEGRRRDGYLYPPLPALCLVGIYRFLGASFAALGLPAGSEELWTSVFCFYQNLQFILILITCMLAYLVARAMGLLPIFAALLVAALTLFNTPLIRVLGLNQINLWVADSILLFLLAARGYPAVAGMAVALGAQIKIYPLALLGASLVCRQWRVLGWFAIATVMLVLAQTDLGRDFSLWRHFLAFFHEFPKGTSFRDNSLHSVFWNCARPFGLHQTVLVQVGTQVAMAAVCLWLIKRAVARERIQRSLAVSPGEHEWRYRFRFLGHSMDAIGASFFLSPTVWTHHFVMAVPLCLWAIATRLKDRPLGVLSSSALVLVLPSFDVFPFAYHRLAGMAVLVWLTEPEKLLRPEEANRVFVHHWQGPASPVEPSAAAPMPHQG